MVRSTIKEAFGTEPKYTKFIADNEEVATRLLDAVDMSMNDDYKIIPEDRTVDNKRVDLTINDSDGTTVAVIEAQDATGWLDSVHASKIAYYCWEKECFDAILITEDASERIKDYVKWLNTHPDLNIYLVATTIYKTDDKPFVDFIPIMRPADILKTIRKTKSKDGSWISQQNPARYKKRLEILDKLNAENPDLFTNITSSYASDNNIAPSMPSLNMAIHPRVNGAKLSFYHAGKLENDEGFKNMMIKHGEENKVVPHFTTTYCNFSFDTVDTALENFKIFKEGVNNG